VRVKLCGGSILPTIDINTVKDDLSGPWWHHVKVADFKLVEIINLTSSGHAVNEGDVLVHKQVLPGEQYPSVRYHAVSPGGSTRPVTNQEVRELLGKSLLAFIEKTGFLPPNCTFIKRFKNGSVQMDFEPSKSVRFALKIVPADSKVTDLDARIETMQAGPAQAPTPGVQVTGVPGKSAVAVDDLAVPKHITRIQGTVALIDGTVEQAEKRTGAFQDHPVTYYMLTIREALVGLGERDAIGYPVRVIKVRLTERKATRRRIQPGIHISLHGKLEEHGSDGFAIKYARCVTTRKYMRRDVAIATPEMAAALLGRTAKVADVTERDEDDSGDDDEYDENDDFVGYGQRGSYPRSSRYSRTGARGTTPFWWNKPVDRAAGIYDVTGTPLEVVFGQLSQKVRRKVTRAIDMLRNQRNMLFIKSDTGGIHGIVRSQSHDGTEYATSLGLGGKFYCVSNALHPCLGLQGTICKHVILTIIAAAKDGKVDRAALTSWIQAALQQWPRLDETEAVGIFYEYKKGPAELSVEWRQIEILPEDLAAF
jgi:hypothetical protein